MNAQGTQARGPISTDRVDCVTLVSTQSWALWTFGKGISKDYSSSKVDFRLFD